MLEQGKPPYIISCDVSGLMQKWSKVSGYQIPHVDFFRGLTKDLAGLLDGYFDGNGIEVISEEVLQNGVSRLIRKSPYPIVSLDRTLIDDLDPNIEGFLDVTRAVDENFEDIGLHPRPEFPPIEQQLQTISKQKGPVTLFDDVLFSGEGLVQLAQELEKRGRPVKQVITGISIGHGINRLREIGIPTLTVFEFPAVIDEVCERDYYAGVPMSGRTVISPNNGIIYSAPYFKPFGNPEKWASIPADKVTEFSDFCTRQSIILWTAVERESQMNIPSKALPRKLKGFSEDVSIVTSLKEVLSRGLK